MPQLTLIKAARELARIHNYSGPKLREAIPYLNAFAGKRFVLKLGGSVLNELTNLPYLIDDILFLKKVDIKVILIHGGSRELNNAMNKLEWEVKSINGLRVTSEKVLELAAKIFSEISGQIKNEIEKRGYKGVIFDRESGFVKSNQMDPSLGLGYVGNPQSVNISLLNGLAEDVVPIVSSVTAGTKPGDIGFNVNADDVAGYVASSIKSEKLILMTDIDGVLDENGKLLSSLTASQVKVLIEKKIIFNGMIPKVETCLAALENGVHKCHIIKGDSNSFINEILTDNGVGTEFVRDIQANQKIG